MQQYTAVMPESPLISTRVPPLVARKLREEAARQRRSLSQLLKIVLEDYVAGLEAAQPVDRLKRRDRQP